MGAQGPGKSPRGGARIAQRFSGQCAGWSKNDATRGPSSPFLVQFPNLILVYAYLQALKLTLGQGMLRDTACYPPFMKRKVGCAWEERREHPAQGSADLRLTRG